MQLWLPLQVNGVIMNMPCHFSPTALAFSLMMHTYIYSDIALNLV